MKLHFFAFSIIAWVAFASSSFAKPQVTLSPDGHAAFDNLLDDKSSLEVRDSDLAKGICGDKKPCTMKLSEFYDALKTYYKKENDHPCAAPFEYDINEIDCGLDGTADLWIQYRGACIYDFSKEESSGMHVLITRDKDGAYLLTSATEYWERNAFGYFDKSYYSQHGSCGAACFIDEIGFLDNTCRMKPLYHIDFDIIDDDKTIHIDPQNNTEIAKMSILGREYYQFIGDLDEKAEIAYINQFREAVAAWNPLLPKVYRIDDSIINQILTTKALEQQIDAAMASCKP